MNLSHIGLVVGNIEKAVKLYTEKLGLVIKHGGSKSGDPVALDLQPGLLMLTSRGKADGRPAGEFSFCFEFPDIRRLESKIDELKGLGMYPVEGPFRERRGRMIVRYAGSDNEVIELYAPIGVNDEDTEPAIDQPA